MRDEHGKGHLRDQFDEIHAAQLAQGNQGEEHNVRQDPAKRGNAPGQPTQRIVEVRAQVHQQAGLIPHHREQGQEGQRHLWRGQAQEERGQ